MKELDDFTVERLEKLIHLDGSGCAVYDAGIVGALARIALAAKTAEPVTWWTGPEQAGEMESFHDHETGSHQIPLVPALYSAPVLNSPELPDGWIPCAERMPESDEHKPIAVYTGNCLGQGMFVAIYDEDGFFEHWEGSEISGVSHWMPLPAPPTTEK